VDRCACIQTPGTFSSPDQRKKSKNMAISLAAAWFLHPSPRLPASEPTAHTHPAARRPPGNRGRRDRDDDEQPNREPSQPRQPDRPIRQGTAQPNAEGGPADHFGWATELNRLNRAAEEGHVTGGRKRGGGGERRRLSLFLPPAQLPLNHHAGTRGYCKPTCNPSEELQHGEELHDIPNSIGPRATPVTE
jgi:hypothetical protein